MLNDALVRHVQIGRSFCAEEDQFPKALISAQLALAIAALAGNCAGRQLLLFKKERWQECAAVIKRDIRTMLLSATWCRRLIPAHAPQLAQEELFLTDCLSTVLSGTSRDQARHVYERIAAAHLTVLACIFGSDGVVDPLIHRLTWLGGMDATRVNIAHADFSFLRQWIFVAEAACSTAAWRLLSALSISLSDCGSKPLRWFLRSASNPRHMLLTLLRESYAPLANGQQCYSLCVSSLTANKAHLPNQQCPTKAHSQRLEA